MKRKSFAKADCPVARSLDVLGDWWTLLIIRDAFDGIKRFNDFQKNLGIAKNILTERLNNLLEKDIFDIGPASDGSAYLEYTLTPKGKKLFLVIVSLRQWGEDCLFSPTEKHSTLVDLNKKPVSRLELRSKTGELFNSENTLVKKIV